MPSYQPHVMCNEEYISLHKPDVCERAKITEVRLKTRLTPMSTARKVLASILFGLIFRPQFSRVGYSKFKRDVIVIYACLDSSERTKFTKTIWYL
jgi:hypothetical protein